MQPPSTHGFREVLVDQPFAGKRMDVDMNLGGGHSTFQGTKFSDFAGGFSYKSGPNGKPIVQNRCIYWRTLNDTLELTEMSMDYNLVDNQVRYIFQDSPIVGPITIQETESSLVILVATVTSVNRFFFFHPKRINEMPTDKGTLTGNSRPSIFHQICNKPQMTFRSYNIYEHAVNIPVPLSAACHFVERPTQSYNQNFQQSSAALPGECLFAFSLESGSIHVYKIAQDESIQMYDLKQANIFTRFFSGLTPSILKGPTSSTEAVIGLSFFTLKGEKNKSVQLVTLAMNGHLNLWHCLNLDNFTEWNSFQAGVVGSQFAVNNYTDSTMLLRMSQEPNGNVKPFFVVFVPGDGFKIFRVQKNVLGVPSLGASSQAGFTLQLDYKINFRDRELVDFAVTNDYLFLLVNNSEEEMEWQIKCHGISGGSPSRFNLALLEPLPYPDVKMYPSTSEPKEFYMDLVFNKSSFSSQTITKALTMFRKEDDEVIKDNDWESLRITAMNVIDREISLATADSDFDISDDEYTELSLKFWLIFYNSCVEYHIHTVKPLGLFYESNSNMVCVVKKSRISFLRPTDLIETLFYFPDSLGLPDQLDAGDDRRFEMQLILKYLEIIAIIESALDENYKQKLDKRLRISHLALDSAYNEIASVLAQADPFAYVLEHSHLIPMLESKLSDLGEHGHSAMQLTLNLISSWDAEGDSMDLMEEDEMDTSTSGVPQVSEFFMGSRVGAHLSYRILKQLMQHRFMIARDTLVLQSLINSFFVQNSEQGYFMLASWDVRNDAYCATTNYYALLSIAEDAMQVVRPNIKERGLKVANILKVFTGDHLNSSTEDYLDPVWPMKVFESFCVSQIGGLAIRRRASSAKSSSILGLVEAAGRALWTSDMGLMDRAFEDFLVSSCQYPLLVKYAHFMNSYFTNSKSAIRNFYLGIASLCLEDPAAALLQFQSICLRTALEDPHFCHKVLGLRIEEDVQLPASAQTSFYVKLISLFQIFDVTWAVERLAADGIKVADNENAATRMCSLAFKSALALDDYKSAYRHILVMPCHDGKDSRGERGEKLASLRMFVSQILTRGEMEVLISLDLSDMFNNTSSFRDKVEGILFAQANLSDPLDEDGVYQMLYLYHLSRDNYHKAAATMYYRAMRLGERARGVEGLEAQKNSYLDVITCLSLVENEMFRFVIQKTGIVANVPPPEKCFDGSEVPVFSEERGMIVRKYSDVQRELELCVMLLKIVEKFPPSPIKTFEFARRTEKAVECLMINHYYDDAIKLSELWDISLLPVLSYFTDVCANLFYNVMPASGDPFDYIRNNDISELPNSGTGATEIGFRLLENYLKKLEKPKQSDLHKEITLKLLAADIELPQWLIASYKKVNTAQLLNCYVTYGEWERGTELAISVLDGTLGRRSCDEFDFCIKKITAYDAVEPVIPFSDIDQLYLQMEDLFDEPKYRELAKELKERVDLFISRVKECQRERELMFNQNGRL